MKKVQNIPQQRISDIVNDNYVNASVLYYFGIKFYDYSEHTLAQVCAEKGLKVEQVIAGFEAIKHRNEEHVRTLFTLPVDLIIEYLKHSHFVFVKQELPYISKLIQGLDANITAQNPVAADLKFIFPLFVEEFIHHIFEEEDTLFHYILKLNDAVVGKIKPIKIHQELEQYSIQRFALDHGEHDDEMLGVRTITKNYDTSLVENLHLRVVYSELKAFEEKLLIHARIENEILFPKALMLEKQVKSSISTTIIFN